MALVRSSEVLVRAVCTCWAHLLITSCINTIPLNAVVTGAAWGWNNSAGVFALETGSAISANGLTNDGVVGVQWADLLGVSRGLTWSVGAEFTRITQLNGNLIKIGWVNCTTKAHVAIRTLVLRLGHGCAVETVRWAVIVSCTIITIG